MKFTFPTKKDNGQEKEKKDFLNEEGGLSVKGVMKKIPFNLKTVMGVRKLM